MKPRPRTGGYTLIEMVVVCAIIVVILGILLPMVGKARFKARCASCTANLRQLSAAFIHYATLNGGHLPRQDLGGTAGNCWGVSPGFVKTMQGTADVPPLQWFCPVFYDEPPTLQPPTDPVWAIGYMVWVPRIDGPMIPPLKVGDPGGCTYPANAVPGPIAGPQRLSDPIVNTVPILTDLVGTEFSPAPDANSMINGGFTYAAATGHMWHGHLDQSNQAFADGRVEIVAGDAVRARYILHGNWNWR